MIGTIREVYATPHGLTLLLRCQDGEHRIELSGYVARQVTPLFQDGLVGRHAEVRRHVLTIGPFSFGLVIRESREEHAPVHWLTLENA